MAGYRGILENRWPVINVPLWRIGPVAGVTEDWFNTNLEIVPETEKSIVE